MMKFFKRKTKKINEESVGSLKAVNALLMWDSSTNETEKQPGETGENRVSGAFLRTGVRFPVSV